MQELNLPTLTTQVPLGSLEAYMAHVNQIPMLSAEEEHQLAIRLQRDNDVEAAKPLILSHLRYVVKVSKNYMGYGLPLNDLIQEGNIGLMKAVKRFDPNMGTRLVTFAIHWIKAELHEFILKNWRIVKIATTKAQRKLFFNLRSLKKKHLGWLSSQEVDEVAKDLNVKQDTVREMEMRMHHVDTAFDVSADQDEDSKVLAPVNYLADHRFSPAEQLENDDWSSQSNDALYKALNQLDMRSQEILRARWLAEDKATLQDLAERYEISAERVRQLEQSAMRKVKEFIEAAA